MKRMATEGFTHSCEFMGQNCRWPRRWVRYCTFFSILPMNEAFHLNHTRIVPNDVRFIKNGNDHGPFGGKFCFLWIDRFTWWLINFRINHQNALFQLMRLPHWMWSFRSYNILSNFKKQILMEWWNWLMCVANWNRIHEDQ